MGVYVNEPIWQWQGPRGATEINSMNNKGVRVDREAASVWELAGISFASLAGLVLAWWCEAEFFALLFAVGAAFAGEETIRRGLKLMSE
jgi:hypothetical protein